jgi:hypothetical protein
MTTLESDFEDELAETVLDKAERNFYAEQDGWAFQFVQRVHDRLRRYGERLDYRVEPIIDSFELVETRRDDRSVYVRLRWTNPGFVFMEYGTPSHTITPNNSPVLSFVWEERHDPPEWVKREYEPEGDGYRVFLPKVEVAGIEKIRQVRTALRWFRNNVP